MAELWAAEEIVAKGKECFCFSASRLDGMSCYCGEEIRAICC